MHLYVGWHYLLLRFAPSLIDPPLTPGHHRCVGSLCSGPDSSERQRPSPQRSSTGLSCSVCRVWRWDSLWSTQSIYQSATARNFALVSGCVRTRVRRAY